MKIITPAVMNLSVITSFDEKLYLLSMNNSFEAENFEPEPTFKIYSNEIKVNHLKSITPAATNQSDITSDLNQQQL